VRSCEVSGIGGGKKKRNSNHEGGAFFSVS